MSSREVQANGRSFVPLLSRDRRYVAFRSEASNLVWRDRNGREDVFLRDRWVGRTVRVGTRAVSGPFLLDGPLLGFVRLAQDGPYRYLLKNWQTGVQIQLNLDWRGRPIGVNLDEPVATAAGGRAFAFASGGRGVRGDDNGASDVFVREPAAATTTRVSVATGGAQANGGSSGPAISADGRYVVFSSRASNLAPGDGNEVADVFVRDRHSGTATRVSAAPGAADGNGPSGQAAISPDGMLIAFSSDASNLVPRDSNDTTDVFVYDQRSGVTTRAGVSSSGEQGSGYSRDPAFVGPSQLAFGSVAGNLVPADDVGFYDHFVRDFASGRIVRAFALFGSHELSFSPEGLWVAFTSDAPTLVERDTNRRGDVFVHGPLAAPWDAQEGPP